MGNGSLRSFTELTEQTLAKVAYAHCVVILETIQECIRTFLDKWQSVGSSELLGKDRHRSDRFRDRDDFHDPPWHMRGERTAEYSWISAP